MFWVSIMRLFLLLTFSYILQHSFFGWGKTSEFLHPCPRAQETACRRRGQEIRKEQSKHCLLDRTGLLHTWPHRICGCLSRPAQDHLIQHSIVERERHKKICPSYGTSHSWWFLGGGKSVSLEGMVPGRLTALQWMVPHPEAYRWQKLESIRLERWLSG